MSSLVLYEEDQRLREYAESLAAYLNETGKAKYDSGFVESAEKLHEAAALIRDQAEQIENLYAVIDRLGAIDKTESP